MAKSLAERVVALEAKVGDKSIAEQFREQAELIDKLFTYRFEQFEAKLFREWNPRFVSLETRFNSFETRFESFEPRFDSLESRFDSLETRLDAMQKGVTILREGMAILLERL